MSEDVRGFELERYVPSVSELSQETQIHQKICAVKVRHANKKYGTRKSPIIVLENLSMTVPKGTIYGLLGPSGCGKTTLLNCIVGQKKLDSGELCVLGEVPGVEGSNLPGPQVGYMPQEIALYDQFSIKETMKYFGWLAKMSSNDIEQRLLFLTTLLNLPDVNEIVGTLSGGQKRRVSLATAVLHEPELLILDEPTVGLDPILRASIWNYMLDITKNRSITIILTTHYIEEAREAHTVGLMRRGYIMVEKSPSNILLRFETENLEDAFTKLCTMQNVRCRRQSIVENVIENNDGTIEPFTDNVYSNRRFSLIVGDYTCIEVTKNTNHKVSQFRPYHIKAIVWKNFLWMFKNWVIMLLILVLPVSQFLLFFVTIGHLPNKLNVALFNYEKYDGNCDSMTCNSTILSCVFLSYLENNEKIILKNYESESLAIESVNKGINYASIIVPENYTYALKMRITKWKKANAWVLSESTIDVYQDQSMRNIKQVLQFYLYDTYLKFIGDYMELCDESRDVYKLPINWNTPIYGNNGIEFTEFITAGALLSGEYMLAAALTAVVMVIEKSDGILERSLVMGVNFYELIISHLITSSILMIGQSTISICCGIFILNITVNGSLILLFGIVILSGFSGIWLGFVFSVTCEKEKTATYGLMGIFLPLIALCGIVWPLEGMHPYLKYIAHILPLTQSIISLRNVMQKGWNLSKPEVYTGIIILNIWTLLFVVTCIVILKLKKS